jgi:hypothetical protein
MELSKSCSSSHFSASVSLLKNLVAYALGVEVRSTGSPKFYGKMTMSLAIASAFPDELTSAPSRL